MDDWPDWHSQQKRIIRTFGALSTFIQLRDEECQTSLPLAITPHYASLLHVDAIRKCVVPTRAELIKSENEQEDPLHEEEHSVLPCLVHRYPDRVLLLATGQCFSYCRYCTRSRIAGCKRATSLEELVKAIAYIKDHKEIRDVLISGGDPLTLEDEELECLIARLRAIPHVELIRIGTKAPVVMPYRITYKLVTMLKEFHPLWMSIHFTHPEEITREVEIACTRLADAGIPLGSQTVLLRGVNDNVSTMKALMHKLVKIRVKPYYLYQCDPIAGSAQFRTPIAKGLEIMKQLRGFTTGYAVPTYVVDLPGGGGKLPLLPDYIVSKTDTHIVLENYQGKHFKISLF